MTIKENYKKVLDNIDKACKKVGRDRNEVTLVAVTKTHEADMINEAIASGVSDIGENKAQELCAKYADVLPVRWHFIGHLQTNKVRTIIDKVVMIHSLDSDKLAGEIDKRAGTLGIVMDVLIQINVGMEETKSGVKIEEVKPLIERIINKYDYIRVRGLMCVPPISEEPEDSRPYFRKVKELFDSIKESNMVDENFDTLSMGMSGDYEVAISEGATIVRVGSAIFGAREYR